MIHHNQLDHFAERGLKASASVDAFLRKHALPANNPHAAPAGMPEPSAGESKTTRPRSPGRTATDELDQIEGSNDVVYLRRIAGDPDAPLGKRRAAERRLRNIQRKGVKTR